MSAKAPTDHLLGFFVQALGLANSGHSATIGEISVLQPNDYQLLAREVPEVSGFALRTLCLPN